MTAAISARLLLASRLTYSIGPDGTLAPMTNQDLIGFSAPVQTFTLPANHIDAALFGVAADALILAFRGTIIVQSADPVSRMSDWLNDADAIPVNGAQLPGLVHRGFCKSLDALWPSIAPVLTAALADPANAQKPLYVTGHSKGGAIAFLAAARIATTMISTPQPFPGRLQCVTFAAARPGDGTFAREFDTLVPHAIRYEYQDDLVPHLPPGDLLTRSLQALPALRGAMFVGAGLFESAGTLTFFDWSDVARTDSLELQLSRVGHLLHCAAEADFNRIVADHGIASNSGYTKDVFAPVPPL